MGTKLEQDEIKVGDKSFSCLFDMGVAVTYMKRHSFEMAFGLNKPWQISKAQNCVAASGVIMSSIGIFKIDL